MVSFDFNLEKEKLPAIEEKLKEESKILRYAILVKKIHRKEEKVRRKKMPIIEKIEKIGAIKKQETKIPEKMKNEGKVELKEIEKKLEEILK
jgi:primase-polymerase (primpol)-like protein